MSSVPNFLTQAELHGMAAQWAGTFRRSAGIHQRKLDGLAVERGHQRWLYQSCLGNDKELAELLDALSHQVHYNVGPGVSGDPAGLRQACGKKLAVMQRNARHLVVLEAADSVLRHRAHDWLHEGGEENSRYTRALASNSALGEILAELEALHAQRVA